MKADTITTPQIVTELAPMAEPGGKLTLDQVRTKLAGQKGKRFWRSLDELADTPAFQNAVAEEFPQHSNELVDPVSRRGFMKLMGASLALAGLTGCTKQPDETIYPYIKAPEDLILGRPMYFATSYPFSNGAVPLLVKSDAFRPIKIEGNPEHPLYTSAVKGPSDIFAQASLLDMYDPDRAKEVSFRGEHSSWSEFQTAIRMAAQMKKSSGGDGIAILSETVTSPTLAAQIQQLQKAYPKAQFVQYDPVNRDSARAASKAAFGQYVDTQYKLTEADVILSLDADFLSGLGHPGFLKLAGDYAERRKLEKPEGLNRLYVVETMPSTTGFKAEHRLGLKASEIEFFALLLAGIDKGYSWTGDQKKFAAAVMQDLQAASGKCVVIPGENATAGTHLAAIALNEKLGNVGKTVVYTDTVNPLPTEQLADLKSLVSSLNGGKVDWLLILGGNPVYSAPVDLDFAAAMGKAGTVVYLAKLTQDETTGTAHWIIPAAHSLESWSDARAYDGTLGIIQPMIDPLYGGKTSHDIIQSMLDDYDTSAYTAVRENNKASIKGDFEAGWRKALHAGFIESTAFTPKTVTAKALASDAALPVANNYEIVFRPDMALYDGRFANIGWLQELPRPVTNLCWDNAALMSMNTMNKLGVIETEIVEIKLDGRSVKAPVLLVPGHPDGSITVHLGFGREYAGRSGSAVGFNAYKIRSSAAPLFAFGGTATKVDGVSYDICVTKVHSTDNRSKSPFWEGGNGTTSLPGNEALYRGIIRYATLEEYRKNPGFAHEVPGVEEDPETDETIFHPWNYKTNQDGTAKNAWAMSIDLNSCVGCNACIVSCYAENNIPVVGREQVKVGRHMAWMRIDTYFEGDLHAPKAHLQPMTCQHCENAGCEQVCPVGATVHTPEGLNTMVYNRCVGTRYCQNNCPYKVRRFNFLLYSDYETESLKLMRNPDVSVRSRGVMEKCTYCIQRIEAAKIDSDRENRELKDGDIITACQQACPTGAIVFGNQNDASSHVSRRKAGERTYAALGDLNYRPRTTYVAGVINPNSELV
jgi:MoCo/4Fe-4S cofactor protein with predicted Tat translocation signal